MATIETEVARRNIDTDLTGRVALVTGGTRGIGAATSRMLASHGATVAAGYSANRERAEELRTDLATERLAITLHQGDLALPDDCRRVIDEVVATHGRIDILVNNAGIVADGLLADMDDAAWHRVLAINLSGAFFTSKAALAHMLEQGSGRVINISSIIAHTGNAGQVNYAASKSGLFGLTTSLAKEAALGLRRSGRLHPEGRNITVNAVSPGFVETEMLDGVSEKALARVRAQIPLDRLGRPDEVARVVRFLASDASAWITGQVWAVNGGMDV